MILFSSFYLKILYVSAVLITGDGAGGSRSAEIYNPLSNTSCSLPWLPEGRYYHSQNGDLVCGGGGTNTTRTSCIKFNPASGTWTQSHTLRQRRAAHVSWATASGVYLIGGWDSKNLNQGIFSFTSHYCHSSPLHKMVTLSRQSSLKSECLWQLTPSRTLSVQCHRGH